MRTSPPRGTAPGQDAAELQLDLTVEDGLAVRRRAQERLAALAAELDRLDRDPEVFARAFHTTAARLAYDAVLAELSGLSGLSGLSQLPGPAAGPAAPQTVPRGRTEELDLRTAPLWSAPRRRRGWSPS